MQMDEAKREVLSIALTFDELRQFSQSLGYPIILVPFGGFDWLDEIYVPSEVILDRVGSEALQNGMFGLVHVIKARVRKLIQ